MPSLRENRKVILIKVEGTYNTDSVPAVMNDEILVEEFGFSYEGARMVERPEIRTSHGTLKHEFGGTLAQVTFTTELKGAGATYSASVRPEADVPLRICGLSSTLDATGGAENYKYAPVSVAHESATIYFYHDGMRYIMTGCRGSAGFVLEAGEIGKVSFTITGHVSLPTDTTLVIPTYDTVIPPIIKGGAFTIGGTSLTIANLSFDLNNEIVTPPDVSAVDGYGEIQQIRRDISGSFDPEAVLVATEPLIADWQNGTILALLTGTFSGAQYNRYSVSMPGVSYREVSGGDRDGISTMEMSFGGAETGTDNELEITFN